jgi:hypothetical protein
MDRKKTRRWLHFEISVNTEGNVDSSGTADGTGNDHDGRDVRDPTVFRVVFVVVVASVPGTRQPSFVSSTNKRPAIHFLRRNAFSLLSETRRQWTLIAITITFLAWMLPFMAAERSG